MNAQIHIPVKGEQPKASWGAAVANGLNSLCPMAPSGVLVREGVTGMGSAPLPQNLRNRRTAAEGHPWKIYGGKRPDSPSTPSKAQRVYVPYGSLYVDGEAFDPSYILGLAYYGDLDDLYELDLLGSLAEDTPSIVHLFVYRETEPSSSGANPQTYAEVAIDLDDSYTYDPDAHEILATVPLFYIEVKADDDGQDVLKVHIQYQHSAIVVDQCGGGAASEDKGCFAIRETEDPASHEKTLSFVNTYVNVAGRTYEVSSVPTVASCAGLILVVYAQTYYSGTTVGCTTVADFAALQARQIELAGRVDIPLYKFTSEGKVEVDFRNAPHLQLFEGISQ